MSQGLIFGVSVKNTWSEIIKKIQQFIVEILRENQVSNLAQAHFSLYCLSQKKSAWCECIMNIHPYTVKIFRKNWVLKLG